MNMKLSRYSYLGAQALGGYRHLVKALAHRLSLRDTSESGDRPRDSAAIHAGYFGLLVDSHPEVRDRRY